MGGCRQRPAHRHGAASKAGPGLVRTALSGGTGVLDGLAGPPSPRARHFGLDSGGPPVSPARQRPASPQARPARLGRPGHASLLPSPWPHGELEKVRPRGHTQEGALSSGVIITQADKTMPEKGQLLPRDPRSHACTHTPHDTRAHTQGAGSHTFTGTCVRCHARVHTHVRGPPAAPTAPATPQTLREEWAG